MPSKDSNTRKPLSGAAKRRKKHEREEAAERAASVEDDGKWAKDFEVAGKPDLENPGTDLDYVRKLQLIVLHQAATTPHPTKAQTATWSRIREMSAVVGMTSNRAQLEAKVRRLEKLLAEKKQDSGIVKVVPGSKVKKPPTARGQSTGPRVVPDGASVTSPPDEPHEE